MSLRFRAAPVLLLTALAACGGEPEPRRQAASGAGDSPERSSAALPRVVFLGDSLAAGYGLEEEQAFPALVGALLAAEGLPVEIVNAGVSGDTTAGGLARVDWVLSQRPDVLVVELGANDGLRGLPLASTEENLRQILMKGKRSGAALVLAGMRLPPNYGRDYTRDFEAIYPRLAAQFDAHLVPFLLEGVGGRRSLNLPDGLHPNAAGHRKVAETVLPALLEALK